MWSASGAPAHTVAHVGMFSLLLASAEQRQVGTMTPLVHGLDCFALSLVSTLLHHRGDTDGLQGPMARS